MVKPTIQKLPKPPIKPSRREMRKEALHEIGQDIHEMVHKFFNTCFGELVLLCIVCALIACFIVLILKLTGNI